MRKGIAILCLISATLASAVSAQEPPPCTDWCTVTDITVEPGVSVAVPVEFQNCVDLYGINLPLTWQPDLAFLDSLSFANSRLDHIMIRSTAAEIDNVANTVGIFAITTSEGPIVPGSGLLVTLYFTVDTLADAAIAIDTTTIPPDHQLTFENQSGTPVPTIFTPGSLTILCDCGVPGDVGCDGTAAPMDVIALANFVYKDWDTFCDRVACPNPAGDVNCDGSVTPLDVIALVNYVFKGWDTAICTPCTD
jgi:hypothetical protein